MDSYSAPLSTPGAALALQRSLLAHHAADGPLTNYPLGGTIGLPTLSKGQGSFIPLHVYPSQNEIPKHPDNPASFEVSVMERELPELT